MYLLVSSSKKTSLKKLSHMTKGFDHGYIVRQTDLIGSPQNYFFESFRSLATKKRQTAQNESGAQKCAALNLI